MWKLTVIALLAIASVRHVGAVCNVCKNGFACISEREFQLCFEGDQPEGEIYTCPDEDDVCSQYGRICMPKGSVTPACRGRENCQCTPQMDYRFVCTSRTTFSMCRDSNYTETKGVCKDDQMCDVQKARNGEVPCTKMCLDDVDDSLICDFEDPVDGWIVTPSPTPSTVTPSTVTPSSGTSPTVTSPTVTSPTVTSPTVTSPTMTSPTEPSPTISPTPPNIANEVCRNQTTSGRFPYPNDTVCTNYVFCHWSLDRYIGQDTPCPSGRYFNRETRNCQVGRPTWCIG